MKEISIYQLRETRGYGFMGWDFAKDKFNFDDYDGEELLNEIFDN